MQEQDDNRLPQDQQEELLQDGSDICQQLMDRYAKSSAPQHRHLLATAAAMRSILASESLPLIPSAYFAAAIDSASLTDSRSLDQAAVAALLSFLSIVVPLVPPEGIAAPKASEAVGVLVGLIGKEREGLAVASVRAAVKCLGILLGFCDLEDWNSVKLGLETLLDFSVDRRPKVRRCAQDYLEKVFTSFKCSGVIKVASKLVLSLLMNHMPFAVKLSGLRTVDGSKDDKSLKPEHLEVLYKLNVVKISVPCLSAKVSSKIMSEILKLMSAEFSVLTNHVLKIIEAFFETASDKVVAEMDKIVASLASFVSLGDRNPLDTVMSAASLLKRAISILHAGDSSSWISNLPLVCGSLAGLLTSEASTASQASFILKDLLCHHVDCNFPLTDKDKPSDNESQESTEASAIKSLCATFENALSALNGIPNEHVLEVISVLFLKLGKMSSVFMRNIVLKLADLIIANGGTSKTDNLQNCIGSAVIAMGPESILTLLPISLHAGDFTCMNVWLIPILKDYVVGASLGYYMEHIVPLAKTFERASRKAKKLPISQDLKAYAHDLWGLLPAFCRQPTDTYQNVGPLTETLIPFLKKDSSMHQSVAVAFQLLVSQNKSVLNPGGDAGESIPNAVKISVLDFGKLPTYTKKSATRNIRALASCSTELLTALTDLFVDSLPEKRSYLKDAIGCLASITDASITKKILMSLFKRFEFLDDESEFELGSHYQTFVDKEEGSLNSTEKDVQRHVILELASCFVEGAKEDLIDQIYKFIAHTFQVTNESVHCEAYNTLSRVLKEHSWFTSLRFAELSKLLLDLKSPGEIASLRSRFACFHILMVHALKMSLEEENAKAFLFLNEIILALKEGKEDYRKAAYDILLEISSSLRDSSGVSDPPYHKLISMIMGYLSGSSPQIRSGAVSALSVLVYKDADICLSMPDLVPSLLSLLHTKAVEVIKAVLGFVKVLVSSLQAKDLRILLSDIVNEVLRWSSVSRHHFRSKVTVIMEIVIRKCGSAAIESLTPEKYKSFLRTVFENRRNKTSSKETGTGDLEMMHGGLSSEASDSMREKKRKKLDSPSEEQRKTKRDRRTNGRSASSNEHHSFSGSGGGGFSSDKIARHSNIAKSRKGASGGAQNRGKRNYNRDLKSGEKRKWMERRNMNKNDQAAVDTGANTSKLRKHKKVGRKQQKMDK